MKVTEFTPRHYSEHLLYKGVILPACIAISRDNSHVCVGFKMIGAVVVYAINRPSLHGKAAHEGDL